MESQMTDTGSDVIMWMKISTIPTSLKELD